MTFLAFLQHAFDQQKAKGQGTIMPNKGVDPEYDDALSNIKQTKRELDEYLEIQRDRLKCRVSLRLFVIFKLFSVNPIHRMIYIYNVSIGLYLLCQYRTC